MRSPKKKRRCCILTGEWGGGSWNCCQCRAMFIEAHKTICVCGHVRCKPFVPRPDKRPEKRAAHAHERLPTSWERVMKSRLLDE